ncbi:hypothetical protein C8Q80DRAFT_303267 [Daedaleopsis nitida]|nr:hypothetical protein C8Q80DRAFT_303267 [Daedaleopsis nitida]
MSSPTLIEDDDQRVQYSGQWIQDPFDLAHGGSRHGAALPDITVTLDFEGTGIQVVGILDRSVDSGYATTSYYIDGKPLSTYTSPFEDTRKFEISFYSVHNLSPGKHNILISNDNGTSPNQFWLDYFLIDAESSTLTSSADTMTSQSLPSTTSPSPSSSPTPVSTHAPQTQQTQQSTLSRPTSSSTSSSTSTITISSTFSSSFTMDTPQTMSGLMPELSESSSTSTSSSASAEKSAPSTSAVLASSSTSSSTNANIIGGAVGGTVSLTLIAVILFFVWRLRKRKADAEKSGLVALDTSSYTGTDYRSAAHLMHAHHPHRPCCAHSTSSCCSHSPHACSHSHSHSHSHPCSRPSYSDMSSRPSQFSGSIISRTSNAVTAASVDERYYNSDRYYGSAHGPSRALSGGRSQSREHFRSESRSRGRGRSGTRHRTTSSVPTSLLSEISPPPSPPPANWSLTRALAQAQAQAQSRYDPDVQSPRRRDLMASERSEEPGQPDEMVELDRGRLSTHSYSAAPSPSNARPVPSRASGGTGLDAGDGMETMLRTEVTRAPWYAPPEQHPDAQSLLSAVAGRRERRGRGRRGGREGTGAQEGDDTVAPAAARSPGTEPAEEEDSGLRIYAQSILPPRYTAE